MWENWENRDNGFENSFLPYPLINITVYIVLNFNVSMPFSTLRPLSHHFTILPTVSFHKSTVHLAPNFRILISFLELKMRSYHLIITMVEQSGAGRLILGYNICLKLVQPN